MRNRGALRPCFYTQLPKNLCHNYDAKHSNESEDKQ